MIIENTRQFLRARAEEFGAKIENEFNKPYVERNKTREDDLNDNGAFFGFISPDEEPSGAYHDFSFVVFPNKVNKPWVVGLIVGTLGFKNDYELATYPGLRRLFSSIIDKNGFCKSDFTDIESSLPKSFTSIEDIQHIKKTVNTYSKFTIVCQIINNPESKSGKNVLSGFLAAYAKMRDWPSNSKHRSAISDSLLKFTNERDDNDFDKVIQLIQERKYIILQGPPGTGKTRLAKEVSDLMGAKQFFTQFHAETSYSDFIYGIRPDISNSILSYKGVDGIFSEALDYAIKHKENTVLIIDEINRANLSNVLGPIFYLFEHKQDISNVQIEISPSLSLNKIPNNFFVIATMNTADRSLAVVDFALRRRFAWYTLYPKPISIEKFYSEDFQKFKEIFEWYANSNELSLQPGQGYFIAESEEEMQNRIRYELLPLIREYLVEGFLKNSKEEFNTYFMNRINMSLFE
ncbi:MAG: AAA family ATPase [Bacteroidales bacterium]|nr:AAA family ATPase [Bacteroidales bacterium]MCF8455045.1 AAA family ATPase [Bacteroidales bacterium]